MSNEHLILSWDEAEDKRVNSSEGEEIGKVKSVGKEFIGVEDGLIAKKTSFRNTLYKGMMVISFGSPLSRRT